MSRGFSYIFLLIAVVVAALLMYLTYPKSEAKNEESIVKSFKSSKYNFSFNYKDPESVEESEIGDFIMTHINLNGGTITINPHGKYTDSPCSFGQPLPTITRSEYLLDIEGEPLKGELTSFSNRAITCKPIVYKDFDFMIMIDKADSNVKEEITEVLKSFKFN